MTRSSVPCTCTSSPESGAPRDYVAF
jgi:hypothetical protein